MVIRGVDYLPPVELEPEEVLDAVLRADEAMAPDDEHGYRTALIDAFARVQDHEAAGADDRPLRGSRPRS